MLWRWQSFSSLTPAELYFILQLRESVFVVEQSCPYLDADGYDNKAHHLTGWDKGECVAYLRAFPPGVKYPEASIGRVLTPAVHRRDGHGRRLMVEGIRRVQVEFGQVAIRISAQAYLEPFYGSLGFAFVKGPYQEDGIPHVEMLRPADST